jgi:hypothetical protein
MVAGSTHNGRDSATAARAELTPGELFDGDIGKLGRFVGDVPLDGTGT